MWQMFISYMSLWGFQIWCHLLSDYIISFYCFLFIIILFFHTGIQILFLKCVNYESIIISFCSLLVRQYDSIGELIRALQKTYVINSKTKDDVSQMWVGLSQIRSLLPVQMSQEEEGLMRERLWWVDFN